MANPTTGRWPVRPFKLWIDATGPGSIGTALCLDSMAAAQSLIDLYRKGYRLKRWGEVPGSRRDNFDKGGITNVPELRLPNA